MPRNKTVDNKALVKMIEEGKNKVDIMKKFGFKTGLQLKSAYMNALVETGKVAAIPGGRGHAKAVRAKYVHVGKRGSIIIPKDLVEFFGIGAKNKFTVRRTKAGLALKKSA